MGNTFSSYVSLINFPLSYKLVSKRVQPEDQTYKSLSRLMSVQSTWEFCLAVQKNNNKKTTKDIYIYI